MQPVSVRPVLSPVTTPPGAFSAPPGMPGAPVAASDQVTLVAPLPDHEDPAPARGAKHWMRVGLLAAAAVAGTAGAMTLMTGPAPAAPVLARASTCAPDTMHLDVEVGQPELASTRIGSPTVKPFTGQALRLEESTGVESKELDGKNLEFRWTHTSLKDSHTGDVYPATDFTGTLEAFQNQAGENWTVHATMQPAGNSGRFASVVVREGGKLTEGQATERATLRTYDRESGNQVRLDELLSADKFQTVLETVQSRLAGHGSFRHSAQDLKEFVAQSFSVGEKDGHTFVTVGVPQAQNGAQGRLAEFTFQLAPGTTL